MKILKSSIIFLVLILGCQKLLEENPQDQVFIENFFQTENDAIAAVNSIYSILNATSSPPNFGGVFHGNYWVALGLASDEMENRLAGATDYDQLSNFNHRPANTVIGDVWNTTYKGISNANFAIEGIPLVNADEEIKNRLLGEARFLRGLLYFNLVRWFGDVPLILTVDAELYPTRSPVQEVYEQIIDDLNFAKSNLPGTYPAGNGLGRATRGAATGLLARVHLKRGNYPECITSCEELLNDSQYGLYNDFKDAFKIENENGKENIFSIGFGTANNSISFWEVGQFNVRLLPRELSNAIPGVNAQGWQVATQNLYDSYVEGDRRKEITLMTRVEKLDGTTIAVEPHIRKYWDEEAEPGAGNTDHDFPYLRYADILLSYAEALNELNNGPTDQAYQAINQVRARARFNGVEELDVLPDLENLSYDEFREALLTERRHEFTGEGHRWYDLVRFEKLQDLVPQAKSGVQPEAFHRLFPIPQYEIDLNQNLLPQNSGY